MDAIRTLLTVGAMLLTAACSNTVGQDELPVSDDAHYRGSSSDPTEDAVLDTAIVPDAPSGTNAFAGSGRCDRSKPFGAPHLAAGLNGSTYDTGARLSPDELTAFFSRTDATGDSDVYVATRTEPTGDWTGARVAGELSSALADGSPSMTADGLTMFLQSSRTGTAGSLDIWVARRATTSVGWGPPGRVATLGSTAKDADPFVRADGRAIVMASNRSGDFDLYAAAIAASGAVSAPSRIAELATTADESNPVLTPDGLAIYFARRGASQDILVARRASADAPFGAPVPIDELNTSFDERPTWISADECVIYLSSAGRAGGVGSSDIYVAERPR